MAAFLSAVFGLILLPGSYGLMMHQVPSTDDEQCPSMFVSVFAKRDGLERRSLIREMWKTAGESYGGKIVAKFALCNPPDDEDGAVGANLTKEHDTFNDTMFMNCTEGYLNGTLTEKVLASMHRFLDDYPDLQMYMKTDDDTFIMPGKLCTLMKYRKSQGKDNTQMFMGVFAEDGETMDHGNPPDRDPTSQFYEPISKFSNIGPPWTKDHTDHLYPVSVKGGPGYILPRQVVVPIVQRGIAAANICNNEDKSVSIWVDKLIQNGTKIELVNLPGTDGYTEWHDNLVESGKLTDYPYIVHHHQSGETIKCLHELAVAHDPEVLIDKCFVKDPVALLQVESALAKGDAARTELDEDARLVHVASQLFISADKDNSNSLDREEAESLFHELHSSGAIPRLPTAVEVAAIESTAGEDQLLQPGEFVQVVSHITNQIRRENDPSL